MVTRTRLYPQKILFCHPHYVPQNPLICEYVTSPTRDVCVNPEADTTAALALESSVACGAGTTSSGFGALDGHFTPEGWTESGRLVAREVVESGLSTKDETPSSGPQGARGDGPPDWPSGPRVWPGQGRPGRCRSGGRGGRSRRVSDGRSLGGHPGGTRTFLVLLSDSCRRVCPSVTCVTWGCPDSSDVFARYPSVRVCGSCGSGWCGAVSWVHEP